MTYAADAVISVSAAEQELMEAYGAREVHLLGHALEEAPIPTDFDARDQIVFLGAIHDDRTPNADSVRWFAAEVLPLLREALGQPALRLTVVGLVRLSPSIEALDGEAVELTGAVDDLPAALARARVLVAPTRFAAGIPHKVHHAAMLGIPMVATPLIAAQTGWQHEQELLVADDAASFAAACARLYRDTSLWERLREQAMRRAREECAPEAFAARVREILADIPITHRRPVAAADRGHPVRHPEPQVTFPEPERPNVSRPAEADFSIALPFGYAPRIGDPVPRIGVMCHLFHPELAAEVLHYLRHLPVPADLLLSTDTEAKRAALAASFSNWDKGRVELRVTPNRGRDIAPKLVGFADRYGEYDLVLHLHSKKSSHAAFLAPWRSYLFETLLGSPETIASILDAFFRLDDLGMVAAQHYEGVRRWLDWRGNFEAAQTLAGAHGNCTFAHPSAGFPVRLDVLGAAGGAATAAGPRSVLRRFPGRGGAAGQHRRARHRAAVFPYLRAQRTYLVEGGAAQPDA